MFFEVQSIINCNPRYFTASLIFIAESLKYIKLFGIERVFLGGIIKQQRWSRGHKARGQGQGHKKNPRPRPRTAFLRTDALEAKDRNARSQGQGPRTQAQAFSEKKKVFKIFFQAISNLLAYPEFLIGVSLNHKSHEMTSSKFFQRGSFCGTNIS